MASRKAHTWSALLAKRKGAGKLHPSPKLVCLRKASSGMMAAMAGILPPHSTVEDTKEGSLQVCSVLSQEKLLSEWCQVTVVSHKPKLSPASKMLREGLQLQSADNE